MRKLILIFFVIAALPASSQRYKYAFNRISTEDGVGLMSNVVYSIYQDQKGFLWIGGSNGIQRFDGGKFVRFDNEGTKKNPLPSVAVTQILPADSNRMWLAAATIRQFGIFNPSDFSYEIIPLQTSQPLPARAEFRMWQDAYQNTFISINRYGRILIYDKIKKAFTENTVLNQLPRNWKASFNVFHDVVKKQYWISCDSGLAVYDERSNQMWSKHNNPEHIPLLGHSLIKTTASEFYIDSKRRHWAFSWEGPQVHRCFDSTGSVSTSDTAGLNGVNTVYTELYNFYETSKGTLWIYGLGNLYSLDKENNRFVYHRNQFIDNYGIRYDKVFQLMEDRDGMIWIATDQGLYYTSPFAKGIINTYLSDVPGELNVTDVIQLQSGDYWLSTWGKGIVMLDRNLKKYASPLYKNIPSSIKGNKENYKLTWAMCQQKATGRVFIGCQGGMLMIFDVLTQKTQYLQPAVFEGKTIRYIEEDNQGQMWFGTQGGQLIKYDGKTFSSVVNLGSGAIIYKILIDKQGWAWLGTQDKGIYAVNTVTGKTEQHYTNEGEGSKLFSNTCYDIEQLNDSIIYASTEVLHIINKKTGEVQQVSDKQGLPSNSIHRLRLDKEGFLWIITDKGLCRYDHAKNRFTSYGKKDGILIADAGMTSDFICQDNYVMFAGINSLLFFHPDAFKRTIPPPDVTLTDFQLGNKYILIDSLQALQEVRLKQNQNNFTISFASLDFRNRDKYVYYYRMQGLDKNWIRAEYMSTTYTSLSPGHYIFEVKAETLDGLSSEKITSLNIYIVPPFWRTWWFSSTLLLVFAMIAYSMHRLRLHRFFAVEAIRNRVARDLHDDMGSTLSTINILSSMAKAKLNTDAVKTGEYINKISDNSQRMMEAMDDIVWAIKPSNDNMHKVVARMREFATNVFEAKEIELDFRAADEVNDVKFDMEARRDFFLVFKEAVNNAAKYSKCTRAEVVLLVEKKQLVLRVSDNGCGFDVKTADNGNGLGNMYKRADALHGKLRILSEIGKGTVIQLSVPLI
ncbi:MAG: two-component regulator propeller domain-containing protein [Lacibacter sp.]